MQAIHKDLEEFQNLNNYYNWKEVPDVIRHLENGEVIVVTNLEKQILWVSSAFEGMTGYTLNEAINRSPIFLQGPLTDKNEVRRIRKALLNREPISTYLINYRANLEPYICKINIQLLKDRRGIPTHFIAFEKEVDEVKPETNGFHLN